MRDLLRCDFDPTGGAAIVVFGGVPELPRHTIVISGSVPERPPAERFVPFTSDPGALEDALAALQARGPYGGSDLTAAIAGAQEELRAAEPTPPCARRSQRSPRSPTSP